VNRLTDEAFVLATQVLGEADLIVTLLTARHGRVRGVARSARRSRKRFGGRLEPMTRVRVGWVEKPGRELHRIESLDGLRWFAEMQADPLILATCAVLAEVSEAFARDGEPDEKSFDLLQVLLEALEDGADVWVVLRYFEHWLLRLHGLLPDLRSCAACGRTPAAGESLWVERGMGVRCSACRDGSTSGLMKLRAADRELLALMRTRRPAELGGAHEAARPGGALEALLRGTVEAFAERTFRCYRHVRAMSRHAAEEGGPR
jgi:DNA repair protein RecO (recombination protein O)